MFRKAREFTVAFKALYKQVKACQRSNTDEVSRDWKEKKNTPTSV